MVSEETINEISPFFQSIADDCKFAPGLSVLAYHKSVMGEPNRARPYYEATVVDFDASSSMSLKATLLTITGIMLPFQIPITFFIRKAIKTAIALRATYLLWYLFHLPFLMLFDLHYFYLPGKFSLLKNC